MCAGNKGAFTYLDLPFSSGYPKTCSGLMNQSEKSEVLLFGPPNLTSNLCANIQFSARNLSLIFHSDLCFDN